MFLVSLFRQEEEIEYVNPGPSMRKANIDNCRAVLEVDIENMLVNAMKSILFKSNYYLIDSDSNPLKYFLCEHHYCAICFEKY